MRKLAALVVLGACGVTAASISAGGSGKANIRLVDRDPLTVRGQGFKSLERVRVIASEPRWRRKTIRATATGSFRVAFAEITLDRCSLVRVATVGARGSQAVLKVLPSPMCTPSDLP